MADEPMTVDPSENNDAVNGSQVNGVESKEEQEVSGPDKAVPTEEPVVGSPIKLSVEEEKAEDTKDDTKAEDNVEHSETEKQEELPETPVNNTRGRKRKASESSAEEEELKGFDPPPEPSPLTKYRIDKIEKDIKEAESEALKLRSSSRPPAKRPHLASPAYASDVSSRPSSGLSVRSESDLMGSDLNNSAANSPQPSNKNRKSTVNLNNPLYRVPMEHGWKRELVYRATVDQYQRRQGDIYYYTPQGKKLRSSREVSEHLGRTGLTIDHFTFFKEPLGLDDPEKEIIRDAKLQKTRTESPIMSVQEKSAPSPIIREGKRTPKPKGPKGASPERGVTPKLAAPFKVKSLGSRLSGQSQTPSPTKIIKEPQAKGKKDTPLKQIKKNACYIQTEHGQMDNQQAYSMMRVPAAVAAYGTKPGEMSPKSGRELCSIHCLLAKGQIPSLQCSVCLCLYHNACEGIKEDVQHFMCKSCQAMQHKLLPSPPPLTSLSSMKTTNKQPATTALPPPPQLQRLIKDPPSKIPQPLLVPVIKTIPVPKIIKNAPKFIAPPVTKQIFSVQKKKSIVGSVTTWLPPSSSIRIAPKPPAKPSSVSPTIPLDILQGRYPQTIAIINGKKYIVVPKHNVLNVPQLSSNNNNSASGSKQAANTPKTQQNVNLNKSLDSVDISDNTEDPSILDTTENSELDTTNNVTEDELRDSDHVEEDDLEDTEDNMLDVSTE